MVTELTDRKNKLNIQLDELDNQPKLQAEKKGQVTEGLRISEEEKSQNETIINSTDEKIDILRSQLNEIQEQSIQIRERKASSGATVEGLKKRPPTNHVAKISTGTLSNAYVHAINRDATERYIITITNGAIKVFTTAGVEKTVVNQTGATNYLASSNPKQDFVAMTVADFTFILNKEKTTAMTNATSPAKVEQAVYSVLQGVDSTPYSITIDGTTTTFTSSNTDTKAIRDGLKSAIGSPSGITLANIGDSSFSITKSSGTLNISASDGFGDDASQVVKDKVHNFSDLPQPAINNMVCLFYTSDAADD